MTIEAKIRKLLAMSDGDALTIEQFDEGIFVGVRPGGCSGCHPELEAALDMAIADRAKQLLARKAAMEAVHAAAMARIDEWVKS